MIGIRVLIVEDDPISARLLLLLLKDRPFSIEMAENGMSASAMLEKAHREGMPFALIFLDIMMPVKDGQKLLAEIRNQEEQQNIPKQARQKIIMTTALDDFENVYQSFQNQCDGYLVKPILKNKLDELLDQVLHTPATELSPES
ncbi:MAG TPA: response regulator [Thermotogota bacterium]|nr:response regulator [Thermotogota bacterium]HRW91453.1 response regulator [Thermotogota bacterium]